MKKSRNLRKAIVVTLGSGLLLSLLMALPNSSSYAQSTQSTATQGTQQTHSLGGISFGGVGEKTPSGPRLRTLQGSVKDAKGKAVSEAIVFLKNLKTGQALSVTTDATGAYRFVALENGVDYQFWAEAEQHKSDLRTISSFDTTMQFTRTIVLH